MVNMTNKEKLYKLLAYWKELREMAPDEKAIKWCDQMIAALKDMIKVISDEENRGS